MKSISLSAWTCLALAVAAPPALAEGDAVEGKKVFNKCRACHDAEAEKNKVGPHLVGVFGRVAGSLEDFQPRYSPNIKEAGADGLVWNDETLTEYLRDPKSVIPKGRMAFPGLKDDADLANVIAYLKADPKP
ncbi:cytochrome c family protein [Nitratireductor mangrovi]|uniref:Cytochrome c family protein n=1 Tax=Nitratireductor mangrovi TaxID=2599600 RepID=A0A5B8L1B1_9HYPH|nr:cytochrome c family protein [Nitratireductor mangrovi]QDZ01452.1 cytochrome c family protein [Nitratireductor mangrovi]